ncbi:MAG TPA: MFS transporter [Candidatus Limnocylindria bacterium]|nr:MFS transporter [Candidatus Limnocylindria bacterium]
MSHWRMASAALSGFVVMGVFWGAWAALVPEIQSRIDATPPQLGAALLWAGAGALPAMIVTGRLWARYGRSLLPATLLLFGLSAVGPAVAGDVAQLAVSLALVGAASGALDVAMNARISEIEATTGRRLMFFAHALFSLAVLLASISVGLLRSAGIGALPVLASVATVFLVLAVLALLGDRGRLAPAASAASASGVRALLERRRSILLLGLLCAGAFLIEDGMISWSALHLERSLGADPAVGGAGPGLFAGAMFVGRAAGLVIAGLGISLIAPALFSRAGRLAGDRSRGAAIAGLTAFGYLGFVVGPPIVGLLAGVADLRVSFAALAGLAAAISLASWLSLRGDIAGAGELPPVARA